MFSGQGSHYYQMGRELFERDVVFRESLQRLDLLANKLCGESVVDAIYGGARDDVFDRTLLTHPAIFMIEYALASRLIRGGVRPDLTLGSSLGSFAAATIAGYIDLEQALAAVIQQAAAFEACCERGGMVAALADPQLFEESFLNECSEMAGINFATHFAVAARQTHLAAIETGFRHRNVTHQRLAVSFAYHSRWIDAARPPFESFLQSICGTQSDARGRLPVVCCEQAAILTSLPSDFFWRVVRGPIRFRDTIALLEQTGPYRYIDVGPSGTLATFVKYSLPASSASTAHVTLTPYGQDQKNLAALLQ
jgi:acyl transferase domain-containing protein